MNVADWWNDSDRRKPKSPCHFVDRKSHVDWTGI